MKVAFLDRDGTINRDYPDDVWAGVTNPEILDGSVQGMKGMLEKGYEIIIISNQYIIGEGVITMEQYRAFHVKLMDILKDHGIPILDTFFCPHARSEECHCCKPETGLIKQALKKFPDIDLAASFMCGDSISDRKCAENMGLPFYGVGIGDKDLRSLAELCDLL